jgi:S1-C subfamily serine protease
VTLVDVLVVLAIIGYALSGFRQGLVTSLLSLGGFVGGAILAILVVPHVVSNLTPGPRRVVIVVLGVLVAAWIGQVVGGIAGGRLRERLTLKPAQRVDQVLGAAAGVLSVALVMWFVSDAIRSSSSGGLAEAVRESRVLSAIDEVMPARVAGFAHELRDSVAVADLPGVFSGVDVEDVAAVDPPDPRLLQLSVVKSVQASTVKITGEAPDCRRAQEGSGSVVAPERVVTNAHVVAGVRHPTVQVAGVGRRYRAQVVSFDSRRDVAVLAVPGLRAPALKLGNPLERGNGAIVVGFPHNGPFDVEAARVRRSLVALGDDIYGKPGVERQVYELFATVEPGNSGGPLVNPRGELVGVVFARSETDAHTGYALTYAEVRRVIARGIEAVDPVVPGHCSR